MHRSGAGVVLAAVIAAALSAPSIAAAAGPRTCIGCHPDAHPDYNGDHRADLTIGAEGAVWVWSDGSVNGPKVGTSHEWDPTLPGVPGPADHTFGLAMAWADFNHDGYDDLTVNSQATVKGYYAAGAITVIYGSKNGLTTAGIQRLTLETPGMPGKVDGANAFGWTMTTGDFDGDGFADLATNWWSSMKGIGYVDVVRGGPGGLTTAGAQIFHGGQAGMPGGKPASANWGGALAAGDFNKDGRSDLAIGSVYDPRTINGHKWEVGGVVVLYGKQGTGLSTDHGDYFMAGTGGVAGVAEGALFGWQLTSGDFNGDGAADLGAASEYEQLPGYPHEGVVHVLYGTARTASDFGGLTAANDQIFTTKAKGPKNLGFGFLASGDTNADRRDELAIGAPGVTVSGQNDSGAVFLLFGSNAGLQLAGARTLTMATSGVPGSAGDRDFLGSAITFGDYWGDYRDDLAVGAPLRTVGGVFGAGEVIVFKSIGDDGPTGTGAKSFGRWNMPDHGPAWDRIEFGTSLR